MKQELISKFNEIYGAGGELRTYFAPGRVNLIGGAYRLQRRARISLCPYHRHLRRVPKEDGFQNAFLFREFSGCRSP